MNIDHWRQIKVPLWIDSHLDLAWNALSFDRDLTQSLESINAREMGMTDSPARGHATVSLPEMRRGQLAVCLATLLVHSRPDLLLVDGHKRICLESHSPIAACAIAHGQLAYYGLLEQRGDMRMIRSSPELVKHWKGFDSHAGPPRQDTAPIGFILAMEGADGIIAPAQVANWFDKGLRVVSPVHYGHNQYAHGTGETGRMTVLGTRLLRALDESEIILDVTHLSDEGFYHALDVFGGAVLASHQNCRSLVPGARQFSDEQLRLLIERRAVIGVPLDNWMILPGWRAGVTPRAEVTLEKVVDHVDHICQLAGTHDHVALGTDLDGGYGSEQCPAEIGSIADVQKLTDVFARRGYSVAAIDALFHGNWLRFFTEHLPAAIDSRGFDLNRSI
jgi:membrane dipeptidase